MNEPTASKMKKKKKMFQISSKELPAGKTQSAQLLHMYIHVKFCVLFLYACTYMAFEYGEAHSNDRWIAKSGI